MLSNYGYEDGSGSYYIEIDTDKCCNCVEKSCIMACPAKIFEIYLDDYDDEVVRIREEARNKLKQKCIICKNQDNDTEEKFELRCIKSCHYQAIKHTW
ncbi:MAG: ferredoxin [Lachnospiraceae bacterium]|nr:ferredoxin [Lachnospiraceae bacterium]